MDRATMKRWILLAMLLLGLPLAPARAASVEDLRSHLAAASPQERALIGKFIAACGTALKFLAAGNEAASTPGSVVCQDLEDEWKAAFDKKGDKSAEDFYNYLDDINTALDPLAVPYCGHLLTALWQAYVTTQPAASAAT